MLKENLKSLMESIITESERRKIPFHEIHKTILEDLLRNEIIEKMVRLESLEMPISMVIDKQNDMRCR